MGSTWLQLIATAIAAGVAGIGLYAFLSRFIMAQTAAQAERHTSEINKQAERHTGEINKQAERHTGEINRQVERLTGEIRTLAADLGGKIDAQTANTRNVLREIDHLWHEVRAGRDVPRHREAGSAPASDTHP